MPNGGHAYMNSTTPKSLALRLGLALFSVAFLAQCKKDSGSGKVKFEILPKKPIVFTADIEINGQTVSAPWFEFRVKAANSSAEKAVTITALKVTVAGVDDSGLLVTNERTFVPSDFDFSLTIGDSSIDCNFSHFGELDSGQTWTYLKLLGARSTCYSGVDSGTLVPTFYVGSNPSGGASKNFNYSVELNPMGWFGSFDEPEDRFDGETSFYTQ